MSDKVVAKSKAMQNLLRAHDAWRGSSFMTYFAAKHLPEMNDQQRKMRLTVLQMSGQLVETELETAMDELVAAWQEYRS